MDRELRSRIRTDMNAALKAGERERVGVLRMLLAELRNKEIEKGRPLTEDEALAVIASGVKSRQESVEQFRAGRRPDLANREEAEIEVVRGYLPAPLSPQELEGLVEQAIAETGASGPKEMGKVMGWLMPRVRGRADGAEVSRRVKEKLAR
jgi:hypothetical protein